MLEKSGFIHCVLLRTYPPHYVWPCVALTYCWIVNPIVKIQLAVTYFGDANPLHLYSEGFWKFVLPSSPDSRWKDKACSDVHSCQASFNFVLWRWRWNKFLNKRHLDDGWSPTIILHIVSQHSQKTLNFSWFQFHWQGNSYVKSRIHCWEEYRLSVLVILGILFCTAVTCSILGTVNFMWFLPENRISCLFYIKKSVEFLSGYISVSVLRHLQIHLLCSGYIQSRQWARGIHTCSAIVRWIGIFLKFIDSIPFVPGLPSVFFMRQMSMLVLCSGYLLNKLLAAGIPISSVNVRWIAISWLITFCYICHKQSCYFCWEDCN